MDNFQSSELRILRPIQICRTQPPSSSYIYLPTLDSQHKSSEASFVILSHFLGSHSLVRIFGYLALKLKTPL